MTSRKNESQTDPSTLSRFSLAVLLLLGAGGAIVLVVLLWPLMPGLVVAAVIAILTHPLYTLLRRRVRFPSLAAFLTTVGILVLVLLPTAGLGYAVGREVQSGLETVTETLESGSGALSRIDAWLGGISARFPQIQFDAREAVGDQLRNLSGELAGRTMGFISGVGGWLLQAGTALFALFFLLRDGERLVEGLEWLVPLEEETTHLLFTQAREVIFATFLGNILVGVVQGALTGFALWLAGVSAAVLWGAVTAVLSMIPMIGSAGVWIPAGILLLLDGRTIAGIAILAFGAVVIGTVDNLLRAYFVGERSLLHPLVVFLSVLGGLLVFGAVGLFVGPVLFVVCVSSIEIARRALEEGRPPQTLEGKSPLSDSILDVEIAPPEEDEEEPKESGGSNEEGGDS